MIVILHNIRSLHNVGSIFRTADAVGATKIFLCGITPAPKDRFGKPRPQLAKVSLGAEENISWEKIGNAHRLIKKLRREGYKILAIEQDKKSIPYHKTKRTHRRAPLIALLVGSEVKGLPSSLLKETDRILEIPMRGAMVWQARHPRHAHQGKESLNVAVAFGVVAFHLLPA